MKNKGVIYILTNPSFPQYVKIGYADNIEERLQDFKLHYKMWSNLKRLVSNKKHSEW